MALLIFFAPVIFAVVAIAPQRSTAADAAPAKCPFDFAILTKKLSTSSLPDNTPPPGFKHEKATPKSLRLTTELRDIFSPSLYAVSEKASELSQDQIRSALRGIESKSVLVSSQKYMNRSSNGTPRTLGNSLELDAKKAFEKNGLLEGPHKSFPEPAYRLQREIENQFIKADTQAAKTLKLQKIFSGMMNRFVLTLPARASGNLEWEYVKDSSAPYVTWTAPVPIGHYGESFSVSLLRTQEVLRDLIFRDLKDRSPSFFREHQEILTEHTARGQGDHEKALVTATLEGLTSFTNLISALTADGVPGASDYRQALRELIEPGHGGGMKSEGLAADFVRRLPMSYIAPMNFAGRYVPQPLKRTTAGLAFSPQLLEALKNFRMWHKGLLEKHGSSWMYGIGLGCPMAHSKGSGKAKSPLQVFFEAYLKVFEKVDEELHAG